MKVIFPVCLLLSLACIRVDMQCNTYRHITFVTSNTGKFEEVKRWIGELDATIILEQAALDLPEYQSLDIHEVARGKAHEAWRTLQKPVLIDDGGIYFEQYYKFPGTFAKYVYQGIGLEGIWKLIKHDPCTYFLSCLVYKDAPDTEHIFEGVCTGELIKPDNSQVRIAALPYTQLFVPEGSTKTLAELYGTDEDKQYNHRYKAVVQFLSWLKTGKKV